jgi:hypothetical protein
VPAYVFTYRHGSVTAVCLLPTSNRLVFVAPDGLHVEQAAPNADDVSWLRTSRIRYATTEMKLFKWGRVTGSLDTATIGVSAITPFSGTFSLGTFGFLTDGNPGEFELPNGLSEWLQMQFQLNGTSCVLSTYQVKAYPAPQRRTSSCSRLNCFATRPTVRHKRGDPETPRQRYAERPGSQARRQAGRRYVEFTNQGAVVEMVLIDEIELPLVQPPQHRRRLRWLHHAQAQGSRGPKWLSTSTDRRPGTTSYRWAARSTSASRRAPSSIAWAVSGTTP